MAEVKVTLMNRTSSDLKLVPTLTKGGPEFTGVLMEDFSITEPHILIDFFSMSHTYNDNPLAYSEVKVEFNGMERYYFIDDVIEKTGGLKELVLSIDLYATWGFKMFASDTYVTTARATMTDTNFRGNPYLPDDYANILTKTEQNVLTIDFPTRNSWYCLVTTGSVEPFQMYTLSASELKYISEFLWSDNFIDNVKKAQNSPWDCIIGLYQTNANSWDVSDTGISSMQLGNTKLSQAFTGIANSSRYKERVIVDKVKYVSTEGASIYHYYSPYSKYQIYLPYIGWNDIDPQDIVDKYITIKYYFDNLTGNVACEFLQTSVDGTNPKLAYRWSGNMFSEIMLSGSDNSRRIASNMNIASSVITAAAGAVSSGAGGALQGSAGVLNSITNKLTTPQVTINKSGGNSGNTGYFGEYGNYDIILREYIGINVSAGTNDGADTIGFPYIVSGTMEELYKGYSFKWVLCGKVSPAMNLLSGITKKEYDMLIDKMCTEGFIY